MRLLYGGSEGGDVETELEEEEMEEERDTITRQLVTLSCVGVEFSNYSKHMHIKRARNRYGSDCIIKMKITQNQTLNTQCHVQTINAPKKRLALKYCTCTRTVGQNLDSITTLYKRS